MSEGLSDAGEVRVPVVDDGNADLFAMKIGSMSIARGTIQTVRGVVYCMTFRSGPATFTVPFPNSEAIRALAEMLIQDADMMDNNVPKPSGLIVPAGARVR